MEFTIEKELTQLNLNSWTTLSVAFDCGWITKATIEEYAISLLKTNTNFDSNIALLADACSYTDNDVRDMIATHYDPMQLDKAYEMKKLKLAALIHLDNSNLSDEEKCKKLQMVYAPFGYPDDMQECSIYSDSKVGPLQAMKILIKNLKQELKIF